MPRLTSQMLEFWMYQQTEQSSSRERLLNTRWDVWCWVSVTSEEKIFQSLRQLLTKEGTTAYLVVKGIFFFYLTLHWFCLSNIILIGDRARQRAQTTTVLLGRKPDSSIITHPGKPKPGLLWFFNRLTSSFSLIRRLFFLIWRILYSKSESFFSEHSYSLF